MCHVCFSIKQNVTKRYGLFPKRIPMIILQYAMSNMTEAVLLTLVDVIPVLKKVVLFTRALISDQLFIF